MTYINLNFIVEMIKIVSNIASVLNLKGRCAKLERKGLICNVCIPQNHLVFSGVLMQPTQI